MEKQIRKNLEKSIAMLKETLALYQSLDESNTDNLIPFAQQIERRRKFLLNKGVHPNLDAANLAKTLKNINSARFSTIEKIAEAVGCHLELIPNNV